MKSSALVIGLTACAVLVVTPLVQAQSDPPEIAIGERLFLETRFAQAYAAQPGRPDLALEYTLTINDPLRGPFAGQTMNCRACHLVDEQREAPRAGMRTYADFAHRSPVPAREDGQVFASRNAMQMVNISVAGRHGDIFHFDGEFNSMEDLVRSTFTGRNFGWLPGEQAMAIRHIATIIREDDGRGELAREFGGSYRKVLTGTDPDIAQAFRLPPAYRVAVHQASDEQIFSAVAKLVAIYVTQLEFAKDAQGNYTGSPYDKFLALNNLPRQAAAGETMQQYSRRLLQAVEKFDRPGFVGGSHGKFAYHAQAFEFGAQELAGMKLFFTRGGAKNRGGNCVSCHVAPHFSDFSFHNSGLTQLNYDAAHGQGSFAKLEIPGLRRRNAAHGRFLPATEQHPTASEVFRRPVNADQPGEVDLGMWNIFANPDFPEPQAKLKKIACELGRQNGAKRCKDETLLPYTIAAFKTPVLRDLGHSEPYMHTGQFTNLKEAVAVYIQTSALAKAGYLRNADVELRRINIEQEDVEKLVAFLKALNEDYD